MFEAFKEFIAGLSEDRPDRTDQVQADCQLAAAALLFHVADLDGVIDAREKAKLRSLISDRFGLDGGQTARLIADAARVDREAVDLFHFTSVLNRSLDHEGRLRVLEMIWEIAYADGKPDEMEETTVWRVAELLGVSTRERVALRQKVGGQPAADVTPRPSPWEPSEEAS